MGYKRLLKEINKSPGPDSVGTSQIVDRAIKGIDISLATIELNNLSASCIASLSGGGGGTIADNSIQNIKLFDKTIENTKIKNGTITSSLLDANLTVSNDLTVINNLIVNGYIDAQNGDLNVAGNISCTYNLTLVNGNIDVTNGNINVASDITCTVITATSEIYTNNLLSNEINVNGNINMQGTGSIYCININANGNIDVNGDMNMPNGSINMNNGDINMLNGSISVGNYLTTSKLTLNNVSAYKVIGTAQLNAGAVTINTIAMNSTSYVFVQYSSVVSLNHLSVLYVNKSSGSFQIKSTNANDNNIVDWMIINPA